MTDTPEQLLLHTLRVAGVSEPATVSARTGFPPARTVRLLEELGERGLAVRHEGGLSGWGLTPVGRVELGAMLAEELDRLGVRGRVESSYQEFVGLNGPVLAACTDWQVVAGSDPLALNDHSNDDYDRGVLDRLGSLHLEALELLARAREALTRFGCYGDRLGNALAMARSGGVDWVTKPGIDSYHSVWFELHEDLLATLGRTRSDERRPNPSAASAATTSGGSASGAAGIRTGRTEEGKRR